MTQVLDVVQSLLEESVVAKPRVSVRVGVGDLLILLKQGHLIPQTLPQSIYVCALLIKFIKHYFKLYFRLTEAQLLFLTAGAGTGGGLDLVAIFSNGSSSKSKSESSL